MKKRILSILLAAVMLFAIAGQTAFAAETYFTDIKDSKTQIAVEVLRLMGVVNGNGDGTYQPDGILTRAEFCKLAMGAMYSDADFSKYSNMTIFPDVRAGRWYAPYINMAAKGLGIINGFPDGTFGPDETISAGQAVTLLLRLIGYTDEEVGGVWPYGHMDYAKTAGMLSGITFASASSNITRGQAARLFVNAIKVDAQGKASRFSFSAETTLKSVDGGSKTMKTSGGSYKMNKSISSSSLVGKSGFVALSGGKALTFVPNMAIEDGGDVAVLVKADGDASVINALAGRRDYTIYKNGCLITADKLKQNDVAIYRDAENRVLVCDTRLTVYYENCSPNPASPSVITALGGEEFEVLPSAASTVSNYRPGGNICLYLTSDGRVAAAGNGSYSGSMNNAVFVVSQSGSLSLVCGNELIELKAKASDQTLWGRVVKLTDSRDGMLKFEAAVSNPYGSINVEKNTLGSKKIAANALVIENGESVSLDEATSLSVSFARENANGEIDFIAVYNPLGGNLVAGRARFEDVPDPNSLSDGTLHYMYFESNSANNPKDQKTTSSDVPNGYVIAYDNGLQYSNVKALKSMGTVDADAFINDKLVNTSDGAAAVFKNAACCNLDTKEWTDLSDALVYGNSFNLYGTDGTVYVVAYRY